MIKIKKYKYLLPLILSLGMFSCSIETNLASDSSLISSQKIYSADFGNGKKGANLTLKLSGESEKFNTKANTNGSTIVATTSQIKSYQLYIVKSVVGTGYPLGGDPIGTDKVVGPVVVNVDFAPSHTINLNNIPGSTYQFGTGEYFYLAVRAWSGINATGTELIKPNNGSNFFWSGTTASTSNVAVSSGAGLQILFSNFNVSTTSAINVTANLFTAFGAGIETKIIPNPGTPGTLASTYINNNRISTIAGISGSLGITDTGIATTSQLNFPTGVAVDLSGNIYIANTNDQTVKKVTTSGVISTIAGISGSLGTTDTGIANTSQLRLPTGVAVDSTGNIYIANQGDHTIRKVTPTGVISTIAGISGSAGTTNTGIAITSQLNNPYGVAVDSSGNVYIANTDADTVKKVTPSGVISTIAGTGTAGNIYTTTATTSQLNTPYGVAVDLSNNVYITDTNNHTIRKVTPLGAISTVAGINSPTGGIIDTGIATTSELNSPRGVTVDDIGNLYIANTNNYTIRKVTPGGSISTIAGISGSLGSTDTGIATTSQLSIPHGVAIRGSSNLYIANTNNQTIKKVK